MNSLISSEDLLKALPTIRPEAVEAEWQRREDLRRRQISDLSLESSKARCASLVGFIREAWHVVEPGNDYAHGWHIDAIADHLTAVTPGQITRLLINIPPGTMKSLLCSVLWPAWEWGPAAMPYLRYFTTSYKDTYVERDARRMRDLVMSEWYQDRWGDSVQLTRTGEASFENTATGWREGVPFKSMTGGRGHRVIIDDPHSTESAESDADRAKAIRTFRESVPTRLVEPKTSAIVVIMQRLHQSDIAGVAIDLHLGYEHLMLPMEFEPDRRCMTSIGFKDPRTYDGELLFPERFPREVVERDKKAMGSFATAGQFQQRPALREGGLFKRAWFKIVKAVPAGTREVRYWDLAATAEQLSATAAYTVGLKLGKQPSGRLIVTDVNRLRAEGMGVRTMIRDTAKADGKIVEIGLPIDPGQAGKSQAQDMVLMLAGYVVHAIRETGDKITRAEPVAAQAEAGNLDLLEADWNEAFIEECCSFPASTFKDQVDALSGAFSRLIGNSVFNVPEQMISMEPTRILGLWPRASALVITRDTVSIVWGARNPATDTILVYDCMSVPRRDLAIHAEQIRTRGIWVPCVFDLEDDRTKEEGVRIAMHLAELGVDLNVAPLDEEAAADQITTLLATGRLRVFSSLTDWFVEYRRYGRDEKGELAGGNCGLMRATGLLASSAMTIAITENRAMSDSKGFDPVDYDRQTASSTTGY
jgi:predicted phage terminase large subunit-like protein